MSDSFFNKVAGWRSTTLLEKSLRRMNFSKLLRAPILLNIYERLLLDFCSQRNPLLKLLLNYTKFLQIGVIHFSAVLKHPISFLSLETLKNKIHKKITA